MSAAERHAEAVEQRQQLRTEAATVIRQLPTEGLEAIRESMRQAGHDPHPPHQDEPYSRRFLIVCRGCGRRVNAVVTFDGTEATYDDATAVPCTAERSYT